MTVHIGPERQLFVDDHLIEEIDGLETVMQRPVRPDALRSWKGQSRGKVGVASIIGNSLHYDEEDRSVQGVVRHTGRGRLRHVAGRRPLGEAESGDSRV